MRCALRSHQRARALLFTACQLPTLAVLTAAFGCVLHSALLSLQCAPRSDSHFSFAALRFAGSLFLWRRHGAAGGDTLRTTLAGGHLMFADTLLFKTMMDILFVDARSPGAEVSPGNRCPLFDARATTTPSPAKIDDVCTGLTLLRGHLRERHR